MIDDALWADLWAEYRPTFEKFGIENEDTARGVLDTALRMRKAPERMAAALKEFAIRAVDKGVPDESSALLDTLRAVTEELRSRDPLTAISIAARAFGTASEDLGVYACAVLGRNVVAAAGVEAP